MTFVSKEINIQLRCLISEEHVKSTVFNWHWERRKEELFSNQQSSRVWRVSWLCLTKKGKNINTYKVILISPTLPHKPTCSVGVTVHSSCLTHSYNYMLPSLYILSLILAFWASFCSASFTKWLGYFVWHFHCAVDIMRQRNVTNTRNY